MNEPSNVNALNMLGKTVQNMLEVCATLNLIAILSSTINVNIGFINAALVSNVD